MPDSTYSNKKLSENFDKIMEYNHDYKADIDKDEKKFEDRLKLINNLKSSLNNEKPLTYDEINYQSKSRPSSVNKYSNRLDFDVNKSQDYKLKAIDANNKEIDLPFEEKKYKYMQASKYYRDADDQTFNKYKENNTPSNQNNFNNKNNDIAYDPNEDASSKINHNSSNLNDNNLRKSFTNLKNVGDKYQNITKNKIPETNFNYDSNTFSKMTFSHDDQFEKENDLYQNKLNIKNHININDDLNTYKNYPMDSTEDNLKTHPSADFAINKNLDQGPLRGKYNNEIQHDDIDNHQLGRYDNKPSNYPTNTDKIRYLSEKRMFRDNRQDQKYLLGNLF